MAFKSYKELVTDNVILRRRNEELERGRTEIEAGFLREFGRLQQVEVALRRRNEELDGKLRRFRDWLKYEANSEGGIVAEIDALLSRAPQGNQDYKRMAEWAAGLFGALQMMRPNDSEIAAWIVAWERGQAPQGKGDRNGE